MTPPVRPQWERMGIMREMEGITPMIPFPPISTMPPLDAESAEVLGNIKQALSLSNGALL